MKLDNFLPSVHGLSEGGKTFLNFEPTTDVQARQALLQKSVQNSEWSRQFV